MIMRKIVPLILVFFMIGIANSNAQVKMKRIKDSKQQVEETVEKLRLAMISGNRAELTNIASDKLTYGHSSGKIENKAEFVDVLATKKSDFVTITLSNQTVEVEGNTAIVRHVLDADTNDGGKPGKVHLGILLVFNKDNSGWKLIARQAVKLQK